MKNSRAIEKAETGTESQSVTEVTKVATTVIGFIASIIGLWAVACIISGVSNSGGPVTLLSNLFKAITG